MLSNENGVVIKLSLDIVQVIVSFLSRLAEGFSVDIVFKDF